MTKLIAGLLTVIVTIEYYIPPKKEAPTRRQRSLTEFVVY